MNNHEQSQCTTSFFTPVRESAWAPDRRQTCQSDSWWQLSVDSSYESSSGIFSIEPVPPPWLSIFQWLHVVHMQRLTSHHLSTEPCAHSMLWRAFKTVDFPVMECIHFWICRFQLDWGSLVAALIFTGRFAARNSFFGRSIWICCLQICTYNLQVRCRQVKDALCDQPKGDCVTSYGMTEGQTEQSPCVTKYAGAIWQTN